LKKIAFIVIYLYFFTQSDKDGTVVEILVEDAKPVGFGKVNLLRICFTPTLFIFFPFVALLSTHSLIYFFILFFLQPLLVIQP
jgi:hypothetical protein